MFSVKVKAFYKLCLTFTSKIITLSKLKDLASPTSISDLLMEAITELLVGHYKYVFYNTYICMLSAKLMLFDNVILDPHHNIDILSNLCFMYIYMVKCVC